MPVSDNIDPVFMKSLPFKITLDMIKNLGVVVLKNPKDLVQLNYFAKEGYKKLEITPYFNERPH